MLVGVVLAAPRLTPAPAGLQIRSVPPADCGTSSPVAGAADQTQEGPSHLSAGQSVDDRVHGGVEHGHDDEPICLVNDGEALLRRHVHQQQDKDGCPADDEHADYDDDGAQQGHGVLRAAVLAYFPAAGFDQDVDACV